VQKWVWLSRIQSLMLLLHRVGLGHFTLWVGSSQETELTLNTFKGKLKHLSGQWEWRSLWRRLRVSALTAPA